MRQAARPKAPSDAPGGDLALPLAPPRGAEDYARAARQQAPRMRKRLWSKTPQHARLTPDPMTPSRQLATTARPVLTLLFYFTAGVMDVVLLLSERGVSTWEVFSPERPAWCSVRGKPRTTGTGGSGVAQHGAGECRRAQARPMADRRRTRRAGREHERIASRILDGLAASA